MAGDLPPLQRTSTGLLPAHIAFVKLLAEVAVEQFLAERESTETAGSEEEATR